MLNVSRNVQRFHGGPVYDTVQHMNLVDKMIDERSGEVYSTQEEAAAAFQEVMDEAREQLRRQEREAEWLEGERRTRRAWEDRRDQLTALVEQVRTAAADEGPAAAALRAGDLEGAIQAVLRRQAAPKLLPGAEALLAEHLANEHPDPDAVADEEPALPEAVEETPSPAARGRFGKRRRDAVSV